MLRSNLSTRPFYNERAVHAGLAVAAVLVVAFTALNVYEIVVLSRQNTELTTVVSRDRAEAERLRREAADIRRGIDKEELTLIVNAAREANALIDQRTFSWTAFFNTIEETLPSDVMLTSVRPAVGVASTVVAMTVLGRRSEDVDEFMERLEASGRFSRVLPRQEEFDADGLHRVQIEAIYVPEQTVAAAGPAVQEASR